MLKHTLQKYVQRLYERDSGWNLVHLIFSSTAINFVSPLLPIVRAVLSIWKENDMHRYVYTEKVVLYRTEQYNAYQHLPSSGSSEVCLRAE